MQRTQVFINDDQRRDISILASMTGTSKAEVIRQALSYGLSLLNKKTPTKTESALLAGKLAMPGLPADLSSRIDDILYGDAE